MRSFLTLRRLLRLTSFSLFVLMFVACTGLSETAVTPTPIQLPATFTPLPAATAVVQPPAPATPETQLGEQGAQAEEAIFVSQPAPGSRIVNSPLQISGEADPTFEQNLVVRLLLADGTELALEPTIIGADLGQRGPFSLEIPFSVEAEQQAFVQVYATSARDGGVTHLASVGLTLAAEGEEAIATAEPHAERIQISQPALGETLSGGTVTVEGFALASFEQTLIVELLDEAGAVIVSEPVTVEAPDLGQPGPFSIELPYTVAESAPGRVVVRDVSPAFGGDVHLASVEVTLAP